MRIYTSNGLVNYTNNMQKFVFYQSNKMVWIVPKQNRDAYVYKNEILPIRMAILEVTEEWQQALYELLMSDKQEFANTVIEELNDKNNFTIYNN